MEAPKVITKKLKRAVTDPEDPPRIVYDAESKPGIANLLSILSACSGRSFAQLESDYAGKMYGHLKVDVAEAVCAALEPVQRRFQELRADPAELERVMKRGAERASERASATVASTYDALGLVPRPR